MSITNTTTRIQRHKHRQPATEMDTRQQQVKTRTPIPTYSSYLEKTEKSESIWLVMFVVHKSQAHTSSCYMRCLSETAKLIDLISSHKVHEEIHKETMRHAVGS